MFFRTTHELLIFSRFNVGLDGATLILGQSITFGFVDFKKNEPRKT